MNKAAHRVIEKGSDTSGLGRWCWTQYRRKVSNALRVILAYRPNYPSGPFTVHAQHAYFLTQKGESCCTHLAFLEDLATDLAHFLELGDQIILMVDANSNLKKQRFSKSNGRSLSQRGHNG